MALATLLAAPVLPLVAPYRSFVFPPRMCAALFVAACGSSHLLARRTRA